LKTKTQPLSLEVLKTAAMSAISIVGILFVLAILSPWVFPNKMVSKNEHDVKH
jgi:hypothetical protein